MTSSGGSVLGGRTSLTMEISVAISTNVTENTLVSYAVPGQDNEIQFRVGSTGAIMLTLDQTSGNVTTAAIPQLLDGKQHSIAFSWDNTAGDVRIYVDGQLVHTATGIKAGTTLDAGGTLVFGHDQDSVNGGFNTAQRLSGTLYDIRVWDRAISDDQISLNYHQVPGSTETGLIANWRMSGLNGGNTVIDSVGGVNLTVANVAVGGSFTASTPTAGLVVAENASVERVWAKCWRPTRTYRGISSQMVCFAKGPTQAALPITQLGKPSVTGRFRAVTSTSSARFGKHHL